MYTNSRQEEAKGRCVIAKICVCVKGENPHLWQVGLEVDIVLKSLKKEPAAVFDHLLESHVVVLFIGYSKAQVEMVEAPAPDCGPRPPGLRELDSADVRLVWRHAGFQNQRPWRTSWHFMEARPTGLHEVPARSPRALVSSCNVSSYLDSPHLLYSQSCGASFWRGLVSLDKEFRWETRLFVFNMSSAPVSSIKPDKVAVLPIGYHLAGHLVHDPFKKRATRKRKSSEEEEEVGDNWGFDDLEDEKDEEEEVDVLFEEEDEGGGRAGGGGEREVTHPFRVSEWVSG